MLEWKTIKFQSIVKMLLKYKSKKFDGVANTFEYC